MKLKKYLLLFTVSLFSLLWMATSVGATVTAESVSTAATENYTLFYDSENGKMYTDVNESGKGTTVYSGQSGKWSSSYDANLGSYILTLKGFSFTTSAPDALVLLKDTTICLAQGTTNSLASTYNDDEYESTGLLACHDLTIYSNGNGTGKLITQGGTCDNDQDNYSDGIFCAGTLAVESGSVAAYGGADAGSSGIATVAFQYFSGDIIAKGGYSLYFLSNELPQVISYIPGTLFYGGDNAQSVSQLSVENGSDDDTLFDDYAYLHIYHTLSDLPYTAWYYQNITALFGEKIVTGYANSDGLSYQIKPANSITRAEFVTILARLMESETDLEQYAGNYAFTDVPKWATNYVGWATEMGYVNGIDEKLFGSNQSITREQMAAILYRAVVAMELTSNNSNPPVTFTDENKIDAYAKEAVAAMQKDGIINGYSNGDGSFRFNPKGSATRAEAFTMIYNFIDAYSK
ncbi:MAG TPA: S-layer homology domain-containing protein [Clostridiales bacterium]|nr:S-layer homology domain-containing protein [Clostridiales bacterium]